MRGSVPPLTITAGVPASSGILNVDLEPPDGLPA